MTQNIQLNRHSQQKFFDSFKTRDVDFRIEQLKQLKSAVSAYEEKIYQALWKDLHKSQFEAFVTEVGIVQKEIALHIRKLKRWSRPERVSTNQLIHFWSTSRIRREPYGLALIIAPWNYPFLLTVGPLIGAISAGNCTALKPSEFAPHTAEVISTMMNEFFPASYISVYQGGVEVGSELLTEKWDYIFFTGSKQVGRIVMEAASRNLTPVTLELGGKNPCIVDEDANLKRAAARIAWGKLVNAGQTCIAPDYLFVHKQVKSEFLKLLEKYIRKYYGDPAKESIDYGRIISASKTERLGDFLKGMTTYYGGDMNFSERYLSPTILTDVNPDDPVMKEEIFGPIFPVLEFESLPEVIAFVNAREKPLGLYYFSKDRQKQDRVLAQTSSGGASINDVIVQFASESMPFGGVGSSGMGSYHGKFSFDTFSHRRSVLKKVNWIDIPLRYPPYRKLGLVRWLFDIW
ncbi:MAG: aldehyde dehydrogenase [Bacteroidales bacterium]|nr:aldehyde dehydrogenase [Bacteroidales bacterium]